MFPRQGLHMYRLEAAEYSACGQGPERPWWIFILIPVKFLQ